MAENRTNKVDAARRQLDAAIRMLFHCEEPFAIHTVVSAAQRILRDLAEKKGDVDWHEGIKKGIEPGQEKPFWAAMNRAANFPKHAEEEPDAILKVDDVLNDPAILSCCAYCESMGYEPSPEIKAFVTWHNAINPADLLLEGKAKNLLEGHEFDDIRAMSRTDQLKVGRELLAETRPQ